MSVKREIVEGFGFNPYESEHYFLVSIPANTGDIQISEHMSWEKEMWGSKIRAVKDEKDERLRVILSRNKWDKISSVTASDFNRRLHNTSVKRGRWKAKGLTPVSRLFGKELVLLAWAIEDADPGRINTAIANWLGLLPEERWWLFTMTNAATGQALRGKNTGWRAAVRFALCDNPIATSQTQQRVGLIAGLDENDIERAGLKNARQGVLFDFAETT